MQRRFTARGLVRPERLPTGRRARSANRCLHARLIRRGKAPSRRAAGGVEGARPFAALSINATVPLRVVDAELHRIWHRRLRCAHHNLHPSRSRNHEASYHFGPIRCQPGSPNPVRWRAVRHEDRPARMTVSLQHRAHPGWDRLAAVFTSGGTFGTWLPDIRRLRETRADHPRVQPRSYDNLTSRPRQDEPAASGHGSAGSGPG